MPTPPQVCVINTVRGATHPFDPNVIEYDRCQIVSGDEDFSANHAGSGIRLNMTITDATTRADIRTAVLADAISSGFAITSIDNVLG